MKNILLSFMTVISLAFMHPLLAQVDQRTNNIIQGVNFIGVSVSNLENAVEFYGDGANLEVVESSTITGNTLFKALAGRDDVVVKTTLMKSSNAQLRFMEFANRSKEADRNSLVEVHGPGIAHICFQVASSTQTYQRFLDSGASVIGWEDMVKLNPANPVTYAYARDPDGAILEIEHIDFDKVSTPRANDYRIRHISLASPNIDRMVEFYSQLLETPDPRRAGRGGTLAGENFDKVSGYAGTRMEMAWFQVRNIELEIVQYHSHPTELEESVRPLEALGHNMIVFDVSDVSLAREALLAAGGSVDTEIGQLDGGEILFGRDPDGNLLGFQAIEKSSKLSSQNFVDNGV